jgi:uncharacterized protein (DUF305 family)
MKRSWRIGLLVLAAGILLGQIGPHARSFLEAMIASMKQMDHDMAAAPMSGDIDHDFASMMIPHHQGAIDMAKAELAYGKDPVMRRLAQEIIVDQQSEIEAMRLRLQKMAASDRTARP